jgi:hypothetical protein
MRQVRRSFLALGCALACAFAPVPPPKTGVAEALLNGFGGGPDQVRHTLESMLPATLQSAKVKGLACLRGEKVPAEWVRARLRVEAVAPGGPVRVRLGGCRPDEALALLTALVGAYESNRRAGVEYAVLVGGQLQQQVWGMQVAQGGGFRVILNERSLSTSRQDGPAVLQRPRLITTGTSR